MVEQSNIGAAVPGLAERGVHIWLCVGDFHQFEGSLAQLQDEGLIPQGFEPPSARTEKRWEAGDFVYWMRRKRPDNWKGSIKSWLELDNWFLRRSLVDRHQVNLFRQTCKSAAVQADLYVCTPAGQREAAALITRIAKARHDKDFQAFKALIPGLIPAKRGRKAKSTTSGAAQ